MIDSTRRNNIFLWAFIHVALLAILLDRRDDMPGLLALIAAVGVIGVVVLWRIVDVPRWLQSLRMNRLFIAAVLIVGTGLLLVTWLVPVEVILTAFQKEMLRAYATLLILAITYVVLSWRARRETDLCLPFWMWLAVGTLAASVGVIITVHYVDRFPQLNTIDELHNCVVQL